MTKLQVFVYFIVQTSMKSQSRPSVQTHSLHISNICVKLTVWLSVPKKYKFLCQVILVVWQGTRQLVMEA